LYKLSRPRPVSSAIFDIPLARAISPSAAATLDKWERFRFVPAETGVDLGDADPRRQYVK
jgi:hypothetical protein